MIGGHSPLSASQSGLNPMSQYGKVLDTVTHQVGYGIHKYPVTYWRVRVLTGRPQVLLFSSGEIDWSVVFRRGMLRTGDLVQMDYVAGDHCALWRITAKLLPDWKVWSGIAAKAGQVKDDYPGSSATLTYTDQTDPMLLVGPLDWAFKELTTKFPEEEGYSHHLCEILGE